MAVDLASFGRGLVRDPEPERGFIGGLMHEIGLDLAGTAKTAAATFFQPFEWAGADVPISWDDLTRRDVTGALAVGLGLFASPVASKAITGTAFAAKLGWAQRAAQIATAEAGVGATFGLIKPLEDGESRLEALITDAAIWGGGGAAFSLIGSGWKATIGNRLGQLKKQRQALTLKGGIASATKASQIQESLGVKLATADSKSIATIWRDPESGQVLRSIDGGNTQVVSDFGSGVADLVNSGYNNKLGWANPSAEGGDPAIDQLRLSSYKAMRALVQTETERKALFNTYEIENILERPDKIVPVKLPESFVENVKAAAPAPLQAELKDLANNDHSQFLRKSLEHGLVHVEDFADGASIQNWLEGFVRSGESFGTQPGFMAIPLPDAGLLTHLLVEKQISWMHPEANPVVNYMREIVNFAGRNQLRVRNNLDVLKRTYHNDDIGKALSVMEGALDQEGYYGITDYSLARKAILSRAQKQGGQVAEITKRILDAHGQFRLRDIAFGRKSPQTGVAREGEKEARKYLRDSLKDIDDLSGFDPIALENNLRLNAPEELSEAMDQLFQSSPFTGIGLYAPESGWVARVGNKVIGEGNDVKGLMSQAAAAASETPGIITITPSSYMPHEAYSPLRVRDRAAVQANIAAKNAFTLDTGKLNDITHDAILEELERSFASRAGANLHDIVVPDPVKKLQVWFGQNEHALSLSGMNQEFDDIVLQSIPVGKPMLSAFLKNKRDLILGKPTELEQLVNNTIRALNIPGLSEATISAYSQAIRRWQGFSKLGGAWSGVVNLTQLKNVYTKLGAPALYDGMKTLMVKKERDAMFKIIHETGSEGIGFNGTMLDDGIMSHEFHPMDAWKNKKIEHKLGNATITETYADVAERIWMMSFRGTEQVNRLASFAAMYKKSIKEGMNKDGAAAAAREFVDTTQYVYDALSLPSAIQGPFGSVLGQFKSFVAFEMEFIRTLKPGKERARYAASVLALGGAGSVLNFPGVDFVDAASGLLFDKKFSEALRIEESKVQASDTGALAKGIVRTATYGLPGLKGIDVSNYLGPGSLIELTQGWLGPSASDAQALQEFIVSGAREFSVTKRLPSSDTYNKFLRKVLPSQIRRFWQAAETLGGEQVRNPYSGKLLYNPVAPAQLALQQAVGAPQVDVEASRAMDDFMTRQTESYRQVRESFRKQIALASIQGNNNEVQNLIRSASGSGISFSPSDVRRAVESYSRDSQERRILRTPEDLRTRFLDDLESITPGGR